MFVSPHSIDGFWQWQIFEIYPDPLTAADKAASILATLRSESSVRDCENRLIDYQSFNVIAKFGRSSFGAQNLCVAMPTRG